MPQVASWLRKNLLLLATFSGQSFSPPYTVKKFCGFPVPSWDVTYQLSLAGINLIIPFLQCIFLVTEFSYLANVLT